MAKGKTSKMEKTVEDMISVEERTMDKEFPDDPSLNVDDILNENGRRQRQRIPTSGPEFVQVMSQAADERILDELLAKLPNNQGYYLKLYKVLGHGELELKEKIENYSGWADIESEVANIIRERSKKFPTRWGSGKYRLIIDCSKGWRGERYKPYDFYVDAGEPENPNQPIQQGVIDPIESAKAQLGVIGDVVKSVGQLMPQGVSANDLVIKLLENNNKPQSDQGMGAALSAMATMMQATMTMMMNAQAKQMEVVVALIGNKQQPEKSTKEELATTLGMLKDLGIIGQPPKQEKDLLTTLTELKSAGIINVDSKTPVAQLSEMKSFIDLAKGIKGMFGIGDGQTNVQESTFDKILDHVGPHVPQLFETVNNFLEVLKQKTNATSTVTVTTKPGISTTPQPQVNTSVPPKTNNNGTNTDTAPPYAGPEVFRPLYEAVCRLDETYFPSMVSMLENNGAAEVVKQIGLGQVNSEQMVALVQQYGGQNFREQQIVTNLNWYTTEFVKWLRKQYATPPQPTQPIQPIQTTTTGQTTTKVNIVAKCNLCQCPYEFTPDEWANDDKMCEEIVDGNDCQGTLIELK